MFKRSEYIFKFIRERVFFRLKLILNIPCPIYYPVNSNSTELMSVLVCCFRPLEVAVSGKRQGVTKSKRNTISGALRISKVWLFHEFVSTLSSQPSLQKSFYPNSDDFYKITYKEAKFCSKEYQSAWNLLKTDYFQNWTKKSEKLLDFKLEDR